MATDVRGFVVLTQSVDCIAAIEIADDGTLRTAPIARPGLIAWDQARAVSIGDLAGELLAQPNAPALDRPRKE